MPKCHCSSKNKEKKQHDCCCEKENIKHHDTCSCTCHHKENETEEKSARICLAVGGVLFLAAVIAQLFTVRLLPEILYIAAYLTAGFGSFRELLEAFSERDFFGENTLMIASSAGAMIIGEMAEGCMVMLLFAIGEMLEHKAQDKSRSNIKKLLDMKPRNAARLCPDGGTETVPPEALRVGDTVLVNAGDTVPCDGEIAEGTANVDTSSITGESLPRALERGSAVRCGYISLDGSLVIRVTAAYADNTFSKILNIISSSSEKKSKSEGFVARFARIYTPAVMALALLVMLVGAVATGNIAAWVYRGLVFLATSCPCAFVISVPLTFFFGIGEMTRIGLLVKGSEYIEKLAGLVNIAFDKTGTLTKGELKVVNIACCRDVQKEELLSLCASLEKHSNHPIAREIVKYAEECAAVLEKAEDIREKPGFGITGTVCGKSISAGSAKLVDAVPELELSDETVKVYISVDGKTAGAIELSDKLRPEAASVIASLADSGVKNTVMLTGDSACNAEKTAKECGITVLHAGLEPAEKSAALERIMSETEKGTTAFVGDGINDAPVLAIADVGIAVGGSGAEIAVETADAVILGSSLEAVSRGVRAAKTIMSRVRFNVIFAITVKLAILLLTLFGYANMALAVFGDVGVTVIVILNSLRKINR